MSEAWDADVLVIGSGFGGAVAALRLTEAGHRVVVLEKGRRHSEADLLRARRDPRAYLWQPGLGLRGFFWQRILRHVAVIGGTGVGGGSIVWAGVLLEPGRDFYTAPSMQALGVDWEPELAPYLARAAGMLGRVTSPHLGRMDDHLRATAESLGAGHTFGPVPLAIHFGREGVTEPDPFFGGEGPDRTGCRLCGECLLGCPYGAKNQLTRNYLHLAERYGAQVRPEHEVTQIESLADGGYQVSVRHPWRRGTPGRLRAPRVVVSAGVLGTVELLHRCRQLGTLPGLSDQLGQHVRTNSEAITAVLAPPGADLSRGPTISSDFHPDADTHVTQNRYLGGWHMRAQVGPMVDGEVASRRAVKTLASILRRPVRQLRTGTARNFLSRLSVLTVMQQLDSELVLTHRRSRVRPWRWVLRSGLVGARRPPSYLPVANQVTRRFAELSGGRPLNLLGESIGGLSVTAHVLGGAVMGADAHRGVVDSNHEVFGHPGLYVADGSVIGANLGVNPSLTITALAERFAARFPAPQSPHRPRAPIEAFPAPAPGAPMDPHPTTPAPVPVTAPVTALDLVRRWRTLEPVSPEELVGDWEAEFVRPLRTLAPRGLGLVGLPDWYGKRFTGSPVSGVNLLRTPGTTPLAEVLPLQVGTGPGPADSRPTLRLTYPANARRPWRWVRDELRRLDADTLVGMTYLEVPGLRRAGTPFLLRRVTR